MTARRTDTTKEEIDEFASFGVRAFTTTRDAGTFGLSGADPVGEVLARWTALEHELARDARALVIGRQVHSARVIAHHAGWEGFLRTGEADGHVTSEKGIALSVSVADCVPVFMAHPSGTVAILHSGWRGTAARIIDPGLDAFVRAGMLLDELLIHLGPAICGSCYEVSADVLTQMTGIPASRPGTVDIRSLIADHAKERGVTRITISEFCTRCDNGRFFSHRAGDTGRQVAVIVASRSG